jgi:integrase
VYGTARCDGSDHAESNREPARLRFLVLPLCFPGSDIWGGEATNCLEGPFEVINFLKKNWSGRRDSNPRPQPWQKHAPPRADKCRRVKQRLIPLKSQDKPIYGCMCARIGASEGMLSICCLGCRLEKRALTKRAIETAVAVGTAPGQAHRMVWDLSPPGFGLKIRPSGNATWVYCYRPKGKPRGVASTTLTLGRWPALGLDAARTAAMAHAARVAQGFDPAGDVRRAKIAERAGLAIAIADYAADMRRRRLVKADVAASALRRGFAPIIGMNVSALDRRTIVELIEGVARAEKRRRDGTVYRTPGAAQLFRQVARTFLEWCAQRGLTPFNALAGYKSPRLSREEALAREARQGHALSDDEIVAVWNTSADAASFGALVRLGLLTGLRRNELAGLRWSDIKDGRIVIPAGRAKMGREHAVPLTPLMQTVLASSLKTTSDLVFPSSRSGDELAGWSKMLPRLVAASGVKFRLHDLRRTSRTLMSRLGVDETTAELSIGHVRRGLVGTYNKDDAWPARETAFQKVSAHVTGLIAPDPDENLATEQRRAQ